LLCTARRPSHRISTYYLRNVQSVSINYTQVLVMKVGAPFICVIRKSVPVLKLPELDLTDLADQVSNLSRQTMSTPLISTLKGVSIEARSFPILICTGGGAIDRVLNLTLHKICRKRRLHFNTLCITCANSD
jgi:hypothetical protein